MTITVALLKYFIAAFLVGIGTGVMLAGAVRLVKAVLCVND